MRLLAIALALSAAFSGACGGDDGGRSDPAGDTTTTGGNDVAASIVLSIQVTSDGTPVRDGTLSCGDAAEGTGFLADQQAAQSACELLHTNARAVRRLVAGRDPDLLCTQIYGGPEVADIAGEIDGQEISATIDRTDGCGIADWDMLSPLIGPPAT